MLFSPQLTLKYCRTHHQFIFLKNFNGKDEVRELLLNKF